MATRTVGALNFNVTANLRQFHLSMNLLRGTLSSLHISSLSALGPGGLGGLAAGAAQSLAVLVGLGVTAATLYGIRLAAGIEQSQKAFELFTGSAKKGEKVIESIQEYAAWSPLEEEELRDAAQRLLAFGTPLEELMPTLRALGDVASGTGEDVREFARILGQARNTGKVLTRDLNELANRGVSVYSELAKVFGTSVEDVMKKVENGQVKFEHLRLVLARIVSTNNKLRDSFKRAVKQAEDFGSVSRDMIETLEGEGVPVFEKLREVVEESTGQPLQGRAFLDFLDQGQVKAQHLSVALQQLEGGRFAGAAARLGKETLLGQFTTMIDRMKLFLAKLGKEVIEQFNLKGLVNDGSQVFVKLKTIWWPQVKQFVTQAKEGFAWFFRFLKGQWDGEGGEFFRKMTTWAMHFPLLIDLIVNKFQQMHEQLKPLLYLIEGFHDMGIFGPVGANKIPMYKQLIDDLTGGGFLGPVTGNKFPRKGGGNQPQTVNHRLDALRHEQNRIMEEFKKLHEERTAPDDGVFQLQPMILGPELMDIIGDEVPGLGEPESKAKKVGDVASLQQGSIELIRALNKVNDKENEVRKQTEIQKKQLETQNSINELLESVNDVISNQAFPVILDLSA